MKLDANLDYSIYVGNNTKFARTIVIKSDIVASILNKAMSALGYVHNELNKTTWKYYMNMAGDYHASNIPMTVKSLDNNEVIPFTKEMLDIHTGTRRGYQYGTDKYIELTTNFPDQIPLIKGILNPVPYNVSTVAAEYEIVWYDKDLIEEGEGNVMPQLQQWIYTWMKGAFHHNYVNVTEDLMMQYLMGVLYMFLPSRLATIRKGNIGTNQAHSFHIWMHLLSRADLIQYKPFLNRKQVLYLYRNIVWLTRNPGAQNTFAKLIEEICSERFVPVAGYDVVHNSEFMLEDPSLSPEVQFKRVLLNMQDSFSNKTYVRTTEAIMKDEIELAKDNQAAYTNDRASIEEDLQTSKWSVTPSKVLESEMRDLSESISHPLSLTLLNEWARLSSTGQYTAVISMTNPVNGDIMTMTVQEAFWLYLYSVWKIRGTTLDVIPYYEATMCLKMPRPMVTTIKANLGSQWVTDQWIKYAVGLIPSVGNIVSTDTFYTTCVEINKATGLLHDMHAYRNWADERAELERLMYEFYVDHLCTKNVGTKYTEFFRDKAFILDELALDDWKDLATKLVSAATGLDSANVIMLADVQKAMINLTVQLSSYNIQVIRKINEEAIPQLDNTALRPRKVTMSLHITDKVKVNVMTLDSHMKKKMTVQVNKEGISAKGTIIKRWHYNLSSGVGANAFGRIIKRTNLNAFTVMARDSEEEAINRLDEIMPVKMLGRLWVAPTTNDEPGDLLISNSKCLTG